MTLLADLDEAEWATEALLNRANVGKYVWHLCESRQPLPLPITKITKTICIEGGRASFRPVTPGIAKSTKYSESICSSQIRQKQLNYQN